MSKKDQILQVATKMFSVKGYNDTSMAELAEKESFDAIIVDLMMPEMDGIEALKLLKKKKTETQVILLIGHATLEKGIEAIKLGAVHFLEKPADMNQLTKKIKKAHAQKMIVVEKQIEENNGPQGLVGVSREALRGRLWLYDSGDDRSGFHSCARPHEHDKKDFARALVERLQGRGVLQRQGGHRKSDERPDRCGRP